MKKCNELKICIEIFFKTLEIFKEYIGKFSHVAIVFKKRLTLCNLYGCNDLYCASDGRIMRFGNAVYCIHVMIKCI